MSPRVSVIIPTYQPDSILGECIASVVRSGEGIDFEIWIVDSSEEDIGQLVEDCLADDRVHVLKSQQRLFPGEARDLGVRASSGEIVVFTDSDCIAAGSWLKDLVDGLLYSGGEVCGGSVENGTPGSYFGTAEYLSEFSVFTPRNPSRKERFIPTCNMAVYRGTYDAAGGFPHDREKGSDVAFGKKLRDAGKDIYFLSGPVVIHYNRTGWRDFVRNQYRLGKGFAANVKAGNQPFSWVDNNAMTRLGFLVLVFPGRLSRIASRALFIEQVSPFRMCFYLPALALGAAGFTIGCISRLLRELPQGSTEITGKSRL